MLKLTRTSSIIAREHFAKLTQLVEHVQALVNDSTVGKTTLDSLVQTVRLISKDIRDDGDLTRELIKQEEVANLQLRNYLGLTVLHLHALLPAPSPLRLEARNYT